MTIRPGLVAITAVALCIAPSSAGAPIGIAMAPMVPMTSVAGAPEVLPKPSLPNLTVPRITVAAERSVRTAEFAEIHVIEQNVGGDGAWMIEYGDGTGGPGVAGTSNPPNCTGGYVAGDRTTNVFRHAYRAPGTYTVTVTFDPECGGTGEPIVGRGTVTVLPGRVLSNGPERLFFYPNGADFYAPIPSDHGPLDVVATPTFEDLDGFPSRVVIAWGDGTRSVFGDLLGTCTETATAWPSTDFDDEAPPPWWLAPHTYRQAGTYTVTVTVTTTGCDGRDPDTVTATGRTTVPE